MKKQFVPMPVCLLGLCVLLLADAKAGNHSTDFRKCRTYSTQHDVDATLQNAGTLRSTVPDMLQNLPPGTRR